MTELIQNIVIAVGLLAVAGIGYFMWQETNQQSSVTAIDEQALTSAVILRQINTIQALELNDAIFNEPRFNELRSFRLNINPVSVGNSNPFAQ